MSLHLAEFRNSYARLPEPFHARRAPTPVAAPRLLLYNEPLARELGIDPQRTPEELAQILSGNLVPAGAEPIATAYAGHQFGQFVPQLGDGRAILLGEVIDAGGHRRELQLKGAGPTPYSRRGDGRAALGPVLREYLVSEAMNALGVPSTRALAAVATGELVLRERPFPGAVLTRVAASHVRVGTFQFFAARGDLASLRLLVDHVIARFDPAAGEDAQPALAMLRGVARRQAALIARWLHVGFVHGVMNTDNMSVSGETIDFGPCAFLEAYDAGAVFSSIDEGGRYAYGRQPRIAWWNLLRLAETLLPLIDAVPERAAEQAQTALADYPAWFEQAWLDGMRAKLGLEAAEEEDGALIDAFLHVLQTGQADFTRSFRRLCDAAEAPQDDAGAALLGAAAPQLQAWLARWRERLAREARDPPARARAMRAVNPAYIPRNHLVERALDAAIEQGDLAPAQRLLQVLAHPFEEQAGFEAEARPAEEHERVLRTFCGT
jgi:uncharacterized protein YdiU (UPF0061 family)